MTVDASTPVAAPSLAALARTTLLAALVAALLLVTMVVPAEYGIDPLGTGRWLGLTAIAAPARTAVPPPLPGAALKPERSGPAAFYPGSYKYDVYEVELEPFASIEYKYQLEQDAMMMFSWTATAPMIQDFHGERASAPAGAPADESYDTELRESASGTFTAPYAGIHGWYWENQNPDPVTVRLTTSGFYTAAYIIRDGRVRTPRPLRGPDTWTRVDAPAPESK